MYRLKLRREKYLQDFFDRHFLPCLLFEVSRLLSYGFVRKMGLKK